MADNRQKRKWILSLRRPIVAVHLQNLSFRVEQNQTFEWSPFLILKMVFAQGRRRSAPQDACDGVGIQGLTRTNWLLQFRTN